MRKPCVIPWLQRRNLQSKSTCPTLLRFVPDTRLRLSPCASYSLQSYLLHLFPHGGHGYGLRSTEESVTTWTQLAADRLKQSSKS